MSGLGPVRFKDEVFLTGQRLRLEDILNHGLKWCIPLLHLLNYYREILENETTPQFRIGLDDIPEHMTMPTGNVHYRDCIWVLGQSCPCFQEGEVSVIFGAELTMYLHCEAVFGGFAGVLSYILEYRFAPCLD